MTMVDIFLPDRDDHLAELAVVFIQAHAEYRIVVHNNEDMTMVDQELLSSKKKRMEDARNAIVLDVMTAYTEFSIISGYTAHETGMVELLEKALEALENMEA